MKIKNKLFNTAVKLKGKLAFKILFSGTDNYMKNQEKFLLSILKKNAISQFGLMHQFSNITSIEQYQNQVPVQEYASMRTLINEHTHKDGNGLMVGQPLYFASTSGTTGASKLIPISKDAYNFSKLISSAEINKIIEKSPEAFDRDIFQIVSKSIESVTPSGIDVGSATGQLEKNSPKMIQEKFAIDPSTLEIEDYESRYYCIIRQAVERDISIIGTANPSTLVSIAHFITKWEKELIEDLFRGTIQLKFQSDQTASILESLTPNPKLANHLKDMIHQSEFKSLSPKLIWPNLKVITCWTSGNCQHYLQKLPELYGQDVLMKDLGYVASELRATFPLELNTATGLPTFNHNFFEFVKLSDLHKVDKTFLTLDKIEQGEQYCIFITNASGLYRYNMNDIIEVDGEYESVPMFKFVQKTNATTDIDGESIYEQEVIKATELVSNRLNIELDFYLFFANRKKRRYDLYLQGCDTQENKIKEFCNQVDLELQKINSQYEAKRNLGNLKPMEVVALKENSFDIYKKFKIDFDCVQDAQFKMNYLTQKDTDIACLHSNIKTTSDMLDEQLNAI